MKLNCLLDGATKDRQSVTADWKRVGGGEIDGVRVIDILSVPKRGGLLTEVLREEWLEHSRVAQVFQVWVDPGQISAWHVHACATDRLFVSAGSITLALYDARAQSPTKLALSELHLTIARPQLVVVPPGVWHGFLATGTTPALVLNLPDRAYAYEDPDHWRLPPDTAQIPYRFKRSSEALA